MMLHFLFPFAKLSGIEELIYVRDKYQSSANYPSEKKKKTLRYEAEEEEWKKRELQSPTNYICEVCSRLPHSSN